MLWQYCASHANKAHLNLNLREREREREERERERERERGERERERDRQVQQCSVHRATSGLFMALKEEINSVISNLPHFSRSSCASHTQDMRRGIVECSRKTESLVLLLCHYNSTEPQQS